LPHDLTAGRRFIAAYLDERFLELGFRIAATKSSTSSCRTWTIYASRRSLPGSTP
jgi:hypothetical protein